MLHQRARTGERTYRHAAADDFAEGSDIGRQAVVLGRAARTDAKTGDDLIEDQERTVPIAE